MNFRQSAVQSLSRDKVTEEWRTMPNDIQPIHLGTGEITLTVDATGMQGLNTSVANFRETAAMESPEYPIERNLHLYRDEALSAHYLYESDIKASPETSFTVMPFGWVEYELVIDGIRYDSADLMKNASSWWRTFQPKEGILETGFTLGLLRIKWTVGMRLHSVEADFCFEAEAQDDRDHSIEVIVKCIQRLRDGRPIYKSGVRTVKQSGFICRSWNASTDTATAPVKVPIQVSWAWACSEAAQAGSEEGSIWLHWKSQAKKAYTGFRLVFGSDRDNTEGEEFARSRARNLREEGIKAGLSGVAHSWTSFFKNAADIQIGSPEKEYLMALSQYVLRAGGDWHSGLPLGTLWTRKFCGATFWDSFYAAEGMLRCGHVGLVREFCDWLIRTAQPKGRPHFWTTHYDGSAANDRESDKAYINCLAYAGIGIRLYEFTRSEDDLKHHVLPYLKIISAYLAEEVFEYNEKNHWRLKGKVAGDIGVEFVDANKQNDTLMWCVLIMAKYAEYCQILEVKDKLSRTATQIAEHFRKNPIRLNHSDIWYTWFPFICPAGPYADFAQWWDGQNERLVKKFLSSPGPEKEIFDHPEVEINPLVGTYVGMAWGNFCTSASFTLNKLPDLGLEFQDGGLKAISGIGYFTECAYETNAGGNSPYIPSSGSYLSSLAVQFSAGSLWSDEVDIAVNFPHLWRGQKISWRNIHSLNGARVSGVYEPTLLEATVETSRPMRARVRVPYRISKEPLRVFVNGKIVALKEQDDETISLKLPSGVTQIKIEQDIQGARDILLIESLDQGERIKELLEKSNHSLRWSRSADELTELAEPGKLIVMNVSFVRPSESTMDWMLKTAHGGASLLLLYHGGILKKADKLAEASGVNGDYSDEWNFKGTEIKCVLTPAGKKILSKIKEPFNLWRSQKITTATASDVDVLAYEEGSKNAVVTRRRYGKGHIYWIASGGTFMDRPETLGWGLHFVREYFVFGRKREAHASLKWLENEAFQEIVQAITKEVFSVKK